MWFNTNPSKPSWICPASLLVVNILHFLERLSMSPEPRTNILMVDDQPKNLIALEAILGGLDENLIRAQSGQEALECLLKSDFAVILLDIQMPHMNGYETAEMIRGREK